MREVYKAVLALALFVVLGTLLVPPAKADAATLYVAPNSQTVTKGANFTVTVKVNTNGEEVNGVQTTLLYPSNHLKFVSTNASSSAFDITAVDTGGNGQIEIARAALTPRSGDLTVVAVTFEALANSGTASLTFASGSYVVRASDQQDILDSTSGGTYTLQAPPSSTPPGGGGGGTSPPPDGGSSTPPGSSTSPSGGGTGSSSDPPIQQSSDPIDGEGAEPGTSDEQPAEELQDKDYWSYALTGLKIMGAVLLGGLAILLVTRGARVYIMKRRRAHFATFSNAPTALPNSNLTPQQTIPTATINVPTTTQVGIQPTPGLTTPESKPSFQQTKPTIIYPQEKTNDSTNQPKQ